MEQRSVDAVHGDRTTTAAVGTEARASGSGDSFGAGGGGFERADSFGGVGGGTGFDVHGVATCSLVVLLTTSAGGHGRAKLLLVHLLLSGGGSALELAPDFGDGEDGFPATDLAVGHGGRGVAEAGGDEGALGPAVADAGHVPVDDVGRGVPVELIAHVDELLDRGDVDVVDRGEVEDHGLERRQVHVDADFV